MSYLLCFMTWATSLSISVSHKHAHCLVWPSAYGWFTFCRCLIAWTINRIWQCKPTYWMDAIRLCQATELKSSTIFVRHVYFRTILEVALCIDLLSNCPFLVKSSLVCILHSILALCCKINCLKCVILMLPIRLLYGLKWFSGVIPEFLHIIYVDKVCCTILQEQCKTMVLYPNPYFGPGFPPLHISLNFLNSHLTTQILFLATVLMVQFFAKNFMVSLKM